MFIQERLEEIKWELDSFIEHPSALPSGILLNNGKYEIIKLEEITERTFVYKGLSVETGEFVSIKEFFPKESIGIQEQLYFRRDFETNAVCLQDPTEVKENQFKQLLSGYIEEAKYIEKIAFGDPIVKIKDAFEDHQTAYIVTSYNQWPSLDDLIKQNYMFTQDELDMIVKQLLDIVCRFHKRGIIHRNVNPMNIFIRPHEIVVDSLGTSDFLQDIKRYESTDAHHKYYAPEVTIHSGSVGTWSDVYAIGKVMIDIICKMTPSGDYFHGLEELDDQRRNLYNDVIKDAIYFDHEKRIQSALELKERLYPVFDTSRNYQTPRSMVFLIAFITIISSFLVVWQYNNDTLMANDEFIIEDEQTPLGAPIGQSPVFFITKDMATIYEGESFEIRWAKKDTVRMIDYKVISLNKEIMVEGSLDPEAVVKWVDTEGYEKGVYQFIAYYEDQEVGNSIILEFQVE